MGRYTTYMANIYINPNIEEEIGKIVKDTDRLPDIYTYESCIGVSTLEKRTIYCEK